MWKQRKSTNLLIVFILILTSHLLNTVAGALSDKRLCADEKCKTIISIGRGKVRYQPPEEGMVSFQANSAIRIMSKSAGSNPSLWGVEVNGREGYAPKNLIREEQIYVSDKNLKYEVSVDTKPVNSLAASEKLLEQTNKVEATTTKPLNLTPAVPITNPLNSASTKDEFRTGSSPVITPVQSEVVDGTQIPIVANNRDDNVKNVNENISHQNQLLTKNEGKTNEYDEKYQKQKQVEKFQNEPKEYNTNIDSVMKESVEKASDKTTQVKGDSDKNIKNLGEERKSVESIGAEEKTHAKVEATQSSAKNIEDGSSDHNKLVLTQNPVEGNIPITANESIANVPAADKTVPTVNNSNQKPVEKAEQIAEKSQHTSSENGNENHDPIKGSTDATKIIPQTSKQNYVKEENNTVPESDLTKLYSPNLGDAQEINKIDGYNSTDNSTIDNNEYPQKQQPISKDTESLEDSSVEMEEIDNVLQSAEISENSDKKYASGPNTDKNAGMSNDSPSQSEETSETDTKTPSEVLNEKAMYEENSAEKVENSVSEQNTDKNFGMSNGSPSQSEEISETDTKTPSEVLNEKAMYEENSTEKVEKSVSEQNTDKNFGMSNGSPSQSEEISETGTKTPSEVLTEKAMYEENSAEKVEKSVSDPNTNKNFGMSNDRPSQSETIEQSVFGVNADKNAGVPNDSPAQSEKIGQAVSGPNTNENAPSQSEKAMYEENSAEKVENSVSEQNTDKNFGMSNGSPSQSEEFSETGTKTPSEVLTEKAMYEDNSAEKVEKSVSDPNTNKNFGMSNDRPSQSETIEQSVFGVNADKNAGVSNDSPAQSEKIGQAVSGPNTNENAPSQSEKAMYEENSAEKVENSVSEQNTDKNFGMSNGSPSQSEEFSETGTKTPSEVLTEKAMYEENSAEKVEKSVSDPNTNKNFGMSNDRPSQSETIEQSVFGVNADKNAGVSNDSPAQSEKIGQAVSGPNTNENAPSQSEKAMYEEKAENSVSGPIIDKNTGLSNDNPSQSEESLVTNRNTPDEVLSGKAIVKDNKYPHTSYIPSPKDLSSENKEIPRNTEEDKTARNDVLTSEKTDLSETLNSNSNHNNNYDSTMETTSAQSKLDTAGGYNDIPTISEEAISQESKPLQSSIPFKDFEQKENKGLFATIMGTVNNMLSASKKTKQSEFNADSELDQILFSVKNNVHEAEKSDEESSYQYCKNIGPNGDCPETEENHATSTSHFHQTSSVITDLTLDTFLKSLASKILEISDSLAFLVIVAGATLFFVFGYYCFCNSSREGGLLLKLNQLESSLLTSHKENAILKHNLMSTRQKLTSIEDNSFGSNDMVVSLKKELEEELMEKARLQEQIIVLQKELENAADAGIELNKIVSELLSSQTGDESIISSVEELQKQLNEQQNTIFEINASLAEKSRENSELQLLIAEQNARYETELANVQRDNDELEQEKGNLITRLDEMKKDFDKDISAALEGKNMEIKRLQNEIVDFSNKLENEHTKWQTSVAKIEALEECLKNVRKDPNVNITEVINVANVKAQLIEIQKKYSSLREKFETESDSRKLAENQLEVVSAEVEKLKQDFNQSEKDKLEAQTRLEVLSNYFKDKENQLQKELSVKEAMWLKQQGETTTTVDRLTAMQEEIQSLKSLNDSLRAEIEAQVAAHKAQTGTLENRAHETWLAARQSDRRYEEARAEATVLRRRLTALAGGNVNEVNKPSTGDELTQAPSPIHMESPGSPMLGRMPPPPFLPPPFMGHPPPFIGMPPPPPFVPPGEMRPAPLGRIMSPPPQRSGRFSPQHLDYEDYLDYESNNTWHRHTYSPPPRTYRSLSPTDSRYNYGTERDLMSTYDTETDFSPPPSPRESRRRGDNSIDRIDSNAKISYGNTKKFNTSTKGPLSSGSEKSFNTRSHNEMKAKKRNAGGGGKTFV